MISALKQKNIECGYLYFYVHFITEIVCFYFLTTICHGSNLVWFIPFIFDGLAFVPQALYGYFSDKHPKVNIGLIGVILLFIAYLIFIVFKINVLFPLFILCVGNGLIHVSGAENTIRNSNGKLSHSALFVGGGSFGVICGKLLANNVNIWLIALIILTMIPFILLAGTHNGNDNLKFDYANKKINPYLVVLLCVFVVMVRGYMGYGIPTSWNKTVTQTVLLFSIMGIGKCAGGVLSDAYGIRKVGIISTLLAIPFLCLGDNYMVISLIGVMMFSMTMSITLALLVSALKKKPGLAFGLTTIGLFLGTVPIFFYKITNQSINIIMIVVLSIVCSFILGLLLKKGDN